MKKLLMKVTGIITLMALTAGVVIAGVAWGAYKDITPNVFAAGTLTINVTGDKFNIVDAMPGDMTNQTVTLTNTGSGKVDVGFNTAVTGSTLNACDYVILTVSATWPDGTYSATPKTVNGWATEPVIMASAPHQLNKSPNNVMNVTVSAQFDPAAPQSVQGGTCNWTETFSAK